MVPDHTQLVLAQLQGQQEPSNATLAACLAAHYAAYGRTAGIKAMSAQRGMA